MKRGDERITIHKIRDRRSSRFHKSRPSEKHLHSSPFFLLLFVWFIWNRDFEAVFQTSGLTTLARVSGTGNEPRRHPFGIRSSFIYAVLNVIAIPLD